MRHLCTHWYSAMQANDPPAMACRLQALLDEVQQSLFSEAEAFRDANIVDVSTYDELKGAVGDGKWARGPWAGQRSAYTACCGDPARHNLRALPTCAA